MISFRHEGNKLSDRAATEVEGRILRGDLVAGARLPTEMELCDMLGVSRSVIRDAIRTLAARGLVEVRHGYGIFVTEPNDSVLGEAIVVLLLRSDLTMGDVLEARNALETGLCSKAAERAERTDLDRLAAHLETFRRSVEKGHWRQAHQEHLDFHLCLLRAIHVPALEILLRSMQQIILLSSLPPRINDPKLWEVTSHDPILKALERRDEGQLNRALCNHYLIMTGDAYAQHRATLFRESPGVTGILNRLLTQRPRVDGEEPSA